MGVCLTEHRQRGLEVITETSSTNEATSAVPQYIMVLITGEIYPQHALTVMTMIEVA
jgi:hypothetical protein